MATALTLIAPAGAFAVGGGGPGTDGGFTGGGTKVILTLEDIQKAKTEAAAAVGTSGPRWQYRTRLNCSGGDTGGTGCGTAADACTNGQFQAVVLRRLVDVAGTPMPGPQGLWTMWGLTCFPNELPGSNLPTLAMVRQAFREIDFAKGGLSIQPVGNVTLVNLPTFFEASWPEAGVGPDEIDVGALLGYRLEIQPMVRSLTYVYGDGNSSGPTESLGGPHPDGDIRWTYRRAGSMATRLDTTYGARFRLQGGAWMTIPDTVTVQGTPVTLTVREAKARLYE
jgi:hypothetical protein